MKAKPDAPRCTNPKCNKPMIGRRKNTLVCSPACRYAVKQSEREEAGPELWISSACKYPAQQQAEIARGDRGHRHPYTGKRPEWSGYCVMADRCGCDKAGCHGIGENAEPLEPVMA
jgi:hypothetical protein